jgi:hypothetical protein
VSLVFSSDISCWPDYKIINLSGNLPESKIRKKHLGVKELLTFQTSLYLLILLMFFFFKKLKQLIKFNSCFWVYWSQNGDTKREVETCLQGADMEQTFPTHLLCTFSLHLFFFFFFCLAFEFRGSHLIGRCSYHLSHSTSPFFVMGFFKIGSHELFAQGWLQTFILQISASWVARIPGMSHQRLDSSFLSLSLHFFWVLAWLLL